MTASGEGKLKRCGRQILILFAHTDAVQIDLHTAQCPFQLRCGCSTCNGVHKASHAVKGVGFLMSMYEISSTRSY